MWKGCILFLVFFAVAFAAEWFFLPQAAEPYRWQFSIALGFLVTLAISQLWGLTRALRRWRLSHKDPANWRNGDLVAANGPLQPLRVSLKAPASQRDVVIYEFQVLQKTRNSKNEDTEQTELTSFGMAPCGIYTQTGMLRLTGFPMLMHFRKSDFTGEAELQNAAQYIAANHWTRQEVSITAGFRQLNDLYGTAESSTEEHFVNPRSNLPVTLAGLESRIHDRQQEQHPPDLAERLYRLLKQQRSTLREMVVEAGATVTVFGKYRADTRGIDIATAIFDANRSLYPGSLNQVVGRLVRNAALGFLVLVAIAGGAHYAAFSHEGAWLRKLSEWIGP